MKAWKKLTNIVLAICIMFTALLVPNMEPAAKVKVSAKNVLVIVGQTYNAPVKITYFKEGRTIKNLKSNSSDLLVKQTTQNWDSWYSDASNNYAEISMYAKKAGKYKVTFSVCNEKNKVVSKHTVNVTATTATAYNSPVKKAVFAGKSTYPYSIVIKTSGKFKVTMNKGFKLKSITMQTYDAQGKQVEKKIKNNANVKLGEYAYKNEYSNEYSYDNSWSYYYYTRMFAETVFTVQYQNTKTKEIGTISYSVFKMPKN